MKRTGVWVLAIIIGLAMTHGACKPPEPQEEDLKPAETSEPVQTGNSDHGWKEIRIAAECTEDEISIDTNLHDPGVFGPGDQISWELEHNGCPQDTELRITDLEYVVDLEKLADVLIDRFKDPESELRLAWEEILPDDRTPVPHETRFDFPEPGQGLGDWHTESIKARDKRLDEEREEDLRKDELWKFSVEVRVKSRYNKDLPCDLDENNPELGEDPWCASWDPHKYGHPKY